MSMKCYDCKCEIDNDSLFCDQCGVKIYICPECRVPGKGAGKRCGRCGRPLVAASDLSGVSPQPQHPQPQPQQPQPQQPQPQQPQPQRPWAQQRQPERPQRLVCRAEGVTLLLADGAMIGRVEGQYAHLLAHLKFISARHAILTMKDDHWIITDVGSRNGTAVNGQWCYNPLPFRKGDIVRIGNFYDFIAE